MPELILPSLAYRTPARIVAVGDSITTNFINVPGEFPQAATTDVGGHFGYGMTLIGNPVFMAGAFGAAGQSLEQIRDIFIPQILAMKTKPGYCILLGGQNNIGMLFSSYVNLYSSICQTLRSNKIEPIIATQTPNSAAPLATRTDIAKRAAFLSLYAGRNGMQLLDFYGYTVDGSNGAWKAGYTSDNVHPSVQGSWAMAQAYLNLKFPFNRPYITQDTADGINLLLNGTFQGAGPVATSWSVGGAGSGYTDSTVADAAINGQWQQTISTVNASQHALTQVVTKSGTTYADGDILAYSGLINSTGCQAALSRIGTAMASNGFAQLYAPIGGTNGGSPNDYPIGSRFYLEFIAPIGSTQLFAWLSHGGNNAGQGGAGTIKWAQQSLINLTALGIAPNMLPLLS